METLLRESFDPLNLHKGTPRIAKRSIRSPRETNYDRSLLSFRTSRRRSRSLSARSSSSLHASLNRRRRERCFPRSRKFVSRVKPSAMQTSETITLGCSILINRNSLPFASRGDKVTHLAHVHILSASQCTSTAEKTEVQGEKRLIEWNFADVTHQCITL